MRSKSFFVFLFLLNIPLVVWSFSETELDSLEKSGAKSLSQSPWRTQISGSLKRNTLLNSSYTDNKGQDALNPLDPDTKDSLWDISRLHYAFSLELNYSPAKKMQKEEYRFFNWLKKTELFLSGSFSSPVLGYRNNSENYKALDYIHYAVEDIALGMTASIYTKGNFFSDVAFSFTPFPLSRFSQEAGFLISYGGGINFLYFLKKSANWSLLVLSKHSLQFKEFSKEKADIGASIVNTPFNTNQKASFVYKQNSRKYIPSSITLSTSYYVGLNFEKTILQDLQFSILSSWKIKERFYLTGALSWKDRVHISNPDQPKIELVNPVHWFSKKKTVFSLKGSYSF